MMYVCISAHIIMHLVMMVDGREIDGHGICEILVDVIRQPVGLTMAT